MKMSKLFRKVMIGAVILFGVISIATSVISGWNLYRHLTQEFTSKGTAIIKNIADSGVDMLVNRDLSTLQAVVDQFAEIHGVAYVYVANADGEIISHTFVPGIPDAVLRNQARQSQQAGGQQMQIVDLPVEGLGDIEDISSPMLAGKAGSVHVGMDKKVIRDIIWTSIKHQQIVLLAIFLISTLLAYMVVNRISRPLNLLAEHAQSLAARDFATSREESSDIEALVRHAEDELGDLAKSFLYMEETLAHYIAHLQQAKAEVEEYSQKLEVKVRERTQELNERNEALEKTLAQLKDAQQQLVMQEKMASLGSLTAGIAHEIKNPLNFVNNFAELSVNLTQDLRADLEQEKDRISPDTLADMEELLRDLEQNVQKINEHGKRADSIVRGMLLHSRGKQGERQLTDLNALVEEYLNLAYHGMRAQDASFNVTIEKDYDTSIGKVNLVPQDISRVLLNVVNNACDSVHEKRKESRDAFAPTLRVSTKSLGDRVEVRVWDNGRGIPPAVLDKVFNPFFTTKPAGKGTGLGLSISYDIVVSEHKGELQVLSEEGKYAEFIITLPKNAA